jgi:predicted RNA-binding Zn ribbon-like protein
MSPVPVDEPALALAVAVLNTYDALESPPDFLSVERVRRLATRYGFGALGEALEDGDLERLRALRERLRPVFADASADGKVAALDAVLAAEATGAGLDRDGSTVRLRARGGRDAVGRLGVLLADALAHALCVGGPARFGTCVADPCRCVYVDRTRGGRQRYCCELCNDRVAAAAYRRRRSPTGRGGSG